GATGAPVLTDGIGFVECRIVSETPSGDHTLVIGEIVEAGVFHEGEALTVQKAGMSYAG
ncbi:MAG: flavin reductase family protein, partial [Gemmatimonadetes bacterium]|nr:flavin reductase family protein [Gemmatimonadota bacterium]